MEWWGWALTASGGVLTIWNAIKAIREATRPFREHAEKVRVLQEQNQRDMERFRDIDAELKSMRQMNQAICKSLFHMMNHMIDGNSVEKLKATREELRTYIIEHN